MSAPREGGVPKERGQPRWPASHKMLVPEHCKVSQSGLPRMISGGYMLYALGVSYPVGRGVALIQWYSGVGPPNEVVDLERQGKLPKQMLSRQGLPKRFQKESACTKTVW